MADDAPKEATKHQAEIRTISRLLILGAPYNPRKIDASARRKLTKCIQDFSFAGTLVWNQATGNLVGGHQRLAIIDALEGTDDYRIAVSVVNLTPKKEREFNIALNNQSMQGQFDIDLLEVMLPDINIASAGFEVMDLEMMFSDAGKDSTLLDSLYSPEGLEAANKASDAVSEAIGESTEAHKAMLQRRQDYNEVAKQQNDDGFMVTLVFKTSDECAAFLERYGWERTADMIDGAEFEQAVEEYIDDGIRGEPDEPETGTEDSAAPGTGDNRDAPERPQA